MQSFSIPPLAKALCLGLMLASAAGPAAAQVYAPPPPPDYPPSYPAPYYPAYPAPDDRADEDIVVYGRHRRVPDDVEALSRRVSYADLDLYYPEDRRELRRRITDTARFLCERLGESDDSGSIVPSCRDAAVRDALRRVGSVEAHWVPRGSYLVR